MKLTKRKLGWTAAGLALAGVLAWAFRQPPVPFDVAGVGRGNVEVTVDAEGRTRIKDRYVVAAPLAGRVLRVELKPGDKVEAGQTVVAAIEPSEPELLDPRTRARAEAQVRAAEASLARTTPLVDQARTARDYARTSLERAQRLFAEKTLSHQELDAAEERARLAEEALSAAEFAVQIARFELQQAEAVLGAGAPERRAAAVRLEVKAPISGRVLRVFQESATVVTPGLRLLEIGDPTNLELEIEALSSDAVRIEPGARVRLEQWGGEQALSARVRTVEPAAFRKVSALGVEEQRVFVIADFVGSPAARARVGDAYRVEARVVVAQAADVLVIPTGALFRFEGEWAVFGVEGGRATLRRIEVGLRNDLVAEVRAGLRADESVILHPSDRVLDGARVQRRE